MRGRSHRIPSNDPADDWGDGSWTVDCVCGVNFDDGEEMVNCDECGVWVHTRCSRFVKGETSFACDKCKSTKNRNDNEETEVAQLLVELPTKTMRMANPSVPPISSFRLWTDIPIEERVHVQGVPGGDPSLFQGLSSVFTSELWKCTGYVPKKFNFQYKEFPCWDEKQVVAGRIDQENENPVDRGADVLFSLSKEVVSASPVEMLVGLKGSGDSGSREMKTSQKERKRRESNDSSVAHAHKDLKKEKIHIRPFGVHLGKQKKDDRGGYKDHSGKKKARSVDKEVDSKKRACTSAIDARKLNFHKDGRLKVVETAQSQETKNGDKRETELQGPDVNGCTQVRPKEKVAANTHSAEESSKKVSILGSPIETVANSEKLGHQDPTRSGSSPEAAATLVPILEQNDVGRVMKQEDVNMDGLNPFNDEKKEQDDLNWSSSSPAVDSQKLKPPVGDLRNAALSVQDSQNFQDSNGSTSTQRNIKGKTEANDSKGDSDFPASPLSSKHLNQHQELSASTHHPPENLEINDETFVGSSSSNGHKAKDTVRESEALTYCNKGNIVEGSMSPPGESFQKGQELKGSAGAFSGVGISAELKHGTKNVESSTKLEGMQPRPPVSISQRKVGFGVGKSSTSSTEMVSKSSVAGGSNKPQGRPTSPNTLRLIHSTKQRIKVNSCADSKRDHSVLGVVRDDARHEISRKTTREPSKATANSGSKTSHLSRNSHTASSKHNLPESKDSVLHPSSKASMAQYATSLCSVESTSVLQTQSTLDKTAASGFSQKSERFNPPQQSSKMNHSLPMHPPAPVNSSTTLSDEELALLLHQELNSSPRVPRVPRVRHVSNMPQVASPAATSILLKRSSSSGGKDNILVPRRKGKEDLPKDGFRNSRELDETKKMKRLLSSPDHRRQDSGFTSDGTNKRGACGRSPEVGPSARKTWSLSSTNSIGPSSSAEATDQNQSSIRQSPRDNSDDDDAGGISGAPTRTLPGLLNEIMSSGRRMTYEELCNAVLPHWHNLRKHNGERYAYSTHSQAVLDCLRNRNEWAQLVDRGPKTNGGRKRRKVEPEAGLVESEEKGKSSREYEGMKIESHREDFPKGKRKARKRRRLALQGRGIKDLRKRRKADGSTDDDAGIFSHSSEEMLSGDEGQGGKSGGVGSEGSASSDEAGSM